VDGSYHDMDSTEMAFRVAAGMAFREGLRKGRPTLLEPVFKLEVLTPESFMGDVLGQLAARGCDVAGTEPRPGGIQAVQGTVPLQQMFGYATELRSATQGRGLFTMEFDHFEPVPTQTAQRILQGAL
jgi:elongation factor G